MAVCVYEMYGLVQYWLAGMTFQMNEAKVKKDKKCIPYHA
jgi:hypothetical protein